MLLSQLPATLSTDLQPVLASVLFALVAHQIFRTHESYSTIAHFVLLSLPPGLAFSSTILLSDNSPSVSWTLFLCYGTYLSTLVTSVVLYRLSPVHPLASYPGPFWCRISKLWLATIAGTGKQSRWFAALHDKCGDIVRVGPNELSVRDASLIAPCMGPSGIPKGPNFIGSLLSAKNVPLVGIQDVDEHMERRRPWARGLSTSASKAYQPLLVKRTQQLVNRLEEQPRELRLEQWFDWFSYDLMSDMACGTHSLIVPKTLPDVIHRFGGGSNQLQDGDTDSFRKILKDGVVPGAFLGHVPHLGVWMGLIPAAIAPLNALIKYGEICATRRLSQGSKTHDIFHFLNNEDQPTKPPPPVRDLVNDGILAVIAGSDTVASALTSLFFCLLTNPRTYDALQKEIDQYYPRGEDAFTSKPHRDMPYLHAVIQEALRLFPPVPTGSGRQVPNNSNGFNAGSIVLPPGSLVYFSPWVIHRDPRNFSFPAEFWPERWLVASGHLSLTGDSKTPLPTPPSGDRDFKFTHNEAAFLSFSHGPMNCVGKGFAMQEMKTVVCALMQRFRFQLKEGWDPREYEASYLEYFVSTRPVLPVTLSPRW
ncbi:high nitrogen upregulated cytochrome P450 monooxygenase 2 [Ganoderma leucocontextum]|nr:high nitrogen upregulated cytochrome P450 monooxygenase 2 [Ganoderma leucocontextum]